MKKFITSVAVLASISFCANAQETAKNAEARLPTEAQKMERQKWQNLTPEERATIREKKEDRMERREDAMERKEDRMEKREDRKERFENASPEQKAKMMERHEKWKNATPEERSAMREKRDDRMEKREEIKDKRMERRDDMRDHQKMDGRRDGMPLGQPKDRMDKVLDGKGAMNQPGRDMPNGQHRKPMQQAQAGGQPGVPVHQMDQGTPQGPRGGQPSVGMPNPHGQGGQMAKPQQARPQAMPQAHPAQQGGAPKPQGGGAPAGGNGKR
jgi:hypothetical protein